MGEPVFFASHFRIKEGRRETVMQAAHEVADQVEAEKPRTVLFLVYADTDTDVVSFLHAFPDADSMNVHFAGADERAAAISEHVQPLGWDVYGSPSPEALENLRLAAASSGVALAVRQDYVAGFLRLAPG
jgi:quinol monooxygenase YgiN